MPHNNLPVETNFSHLGAIHKKAKGRLSAENESQLNQHLQNHVFSSRDKWKPTKINIDTLQKGMIKHVSEMGAVEEKELESPSARYFQKLLRDAKRARPPHRKTLDGIKMSLPS